MKFKFLSTPLQAVLCTMVFFSIFFFGVLAAVSICDFFVK